MPPPPRPEEVDFAALSQRSRAATAAARKTEGPQTRHPWSERDAQTLIQAVSRYHARWSIIEMLAHEGTLPFERLRDQQAFRDKARLIKQDILKWVACLSLPSLRATTSNLPSLPSPRTDQLLPPSFDSVALGKKEKEVIKGVGRNPDRREHDVDHALNKPTNTLYAGNPLP